MRVATRHEIKDYAGCMHKQDVVEIEHLINCFLARDLPQSVVQDLRAYCQLSMVPRECQDPCEVNPRAEALDRAMIRDLKRHEAAVAKVKNLLECVDEFLAEMIGKIRRAYTLNAKFDDEIRQPIMFSELFETATPDHIVARFRGKHGDVYVAAAKAWTGHIAPWMRANAAGLKRMH